MEGAAALGITALLTLGIFLFSMVSFNYQDTSASSTQIIVENQQGETTIYTSNDYQMKPDEASIWFKETSGEEHTISYRTNKIIIHAESDQEVTDEKATTTDLSNMTDHRKD